MTSDTVYSSSKLYPEDAVMWRLSASRPPIYVNGRLGANISWNTRQVNICLTNIWHAVTVPQTVSLWVHSQQESGSWWSERHSRAVGTPGMRNRPAEWRNWRTKISCIIQSGAVITRSIFSKILKIDTHSSPVRARYGCLLWVLTMV